MEKQTQKILSACKRSIAQEKSRFKEKRNGDNILALTRETVFGLHQLLCEEPLLTSRVSNWYTFQSG